LFAADLESEFNNLVDNINTLDNDNIATGANISPSKLSATIAGDGIARNGSTGILEVNDDNSTLEVSGDILQVKDDGVTVSKIAEQAALSVLGNGTNATANVTALTAGTDGHVLRRSGTAVAFGQVAADGLASDAVTTAKILDANVTKAKLAALGQQISASSGAFSTSSTSDIDVTNLSVSLTTTGRPVFIGLISDGSGSSTRSEITATSNTNLSRGDVVFVRSSTEIGRYRVEIAADVTVGTSLTQTKISPPYMIDVPAAGTYTYKIQVKAIAATDVVQIRYMKLVAFEL